MCLLCNINNRAKFYWKKWTNEINQSVNQLRTGTDRRHGRLYYGFTGIFDEGCCKSPLAIYLVPAKFSFLIFLSYSLCNSRQQDRNFYMSSRLLHLVSILHLCSFGLSSSLGILFFTWAFFFIFDSLLYLDYLSFFLFKIGTQFFTDLSYSLRLYTLDPYKSFLWQNFYDNFFFIKIIYDKNFYDKTFL